MKKRWITTFLVVFLVFFLGAISVFGAECECSPGDTCCSDGCNFDSLGTLCNDNDLNTYDDMCNSFGNCSGISIDGNEEGVMVPEEEIFNASLCGNRKIDSGENCLNCRDATCLIDEVCNTEGKCVPRPVTFTSFDAVLIVVIIIVLALSFFGIRYYRKKNKISRKDSVIYWISVLFLLLAVMFFAHVFSSISFPFYHKAESEPIIIIEKQVALQLNELYDTFGYDESVACLKGKHVKGKYQIYALEIPEIYSSSPFAVESGQCARYNTVGTIHSHPAGICNLSKRDVYTFAAKNLPITGVMCERNTYAFYTPGNLDTSVFYIVRNVTEFKEERPVEESKVDLRFILMPLTIILIAILSMFSFKFLKTKLKFRRRVSPKYMSLLRLLNKDEQAVMMVILRYGKLTRKKLLFKSNLEWDVINHALSSLEKRGVIKIKKHYTEPSLSDKIFLNK